MRLRRGRGRVPEGAEEAILNYEKVYTAEEWEEMKEEVFAALDEEDANRTIFTKFGGWKKVWALGRE